MKRLVIATGVSALLLAGCAPQSGTTTSTAPDATAPAAPAVPAEARPLLAAYGLDGKDPEELVDHLDRLAVKDRPADLKASVRPDQLVISSGTQEFTLAIPADRFYLSVAPYVSRTHECFHHSLTTCAGELAGKDVHVTIVDEANGSVLVDGTHSTFDNGFVGFWLPRGVDATLRVAYGGKAGETRIGTGKDAPTCLTTLRLR